MSLESVAYRLRARRTRSNNLLGVLVPEKLLHFYYDYSYTMIKQVEKQTKTKILDDYREVLPDVLKKVKDVALVDTPDTE